MELGLFDPLVSDVVIRELALAPPHVREFFETVRPHLSTIEVPMAALALTEAYIEAGIVGERWRADAIHVAVATVMGCQAIVSWNFRHIVHFGKIPLYNGVNLTKGYNSIGIHTPREIIRYEEGQNL